MKYTAVRGTRDILPEEMKKWHFIENTAREVFKNCGFGEMRTPLFEQTELFVRSIGSDTDIVTKEMYNFKDKKGRDLSLRPEGTAGIIRAAIENKLLNEGQLSKFYYIGPMYRYERPQKGRQREFYQIGAELVGIKHFLHEYEAIWTLYTILTKLGLKNLKLFINNIGCKVCRLKYMQSLTNYFNNNISQMCPDCNRRFHTNILRTLDCKEDKDIQIIRSAPKITDFICKDCQSSSLELQGALKTGGIDYEIDPYMVRGLDYYTNNVFEIKSTGLGAQDTLAAGGRYDSLVSEMGGAEMSGTGFSIGVERLLLACEHENVINNWKLEKTDIYVAILGKEAVKTSTADLINPLRNNNISCDYGFSPDNNLKSLLKTADRLKTAYVIIIGNDELTSGKAIVKNMKDGTQEEIKIDVLVDEIKIKLKNT